MKIIDFPYEVGNTCASNKKECANTCALKTEFLSSRFREGQFCAAIRFASGHYDKRVPANLWEPEIVDGEILRYTRDDYYNTIDRHAGVPKAVFKVIKYIAPIETSSLWDSKGKPGSLLLQAADGTVFEALDCQKVRRTQYKIYLSTQISKFTGTDLVGISLVGCSASEAKTILTLVDKYKKEEMQRQRESREKAEKKRMEQQAAEKRKLEELQAEEELNSIFSTYQILTCPTCKTKCRIPKGKGRIRITCPNCKNSFIGDS